MDLVKIGRFITELRKEKGFTQEQLGERIGVTNKTISRWETGNYLPPADIFVTMSKLFDVSINELLSGKKLSQSEYQQAAEENFQQIIKTNMFSLKERMYYYKKKWLKEHIDIMIFFSICIIATLIIGITKQIIFIISLVPIEILIAHCWRVNAMMSYVEKNAFDGTGK